MELVGTVKRLLDERLDPKPDGYSVGFNSGAAAGQTVPHAHVHVIPRYAGDMGDPRGEGRGREAGLINGSGKREHGSRQQRRGRRHGDYPACEGCRHELAGRSSTHAVNSRAV